MRGAVFLEDVSLLADADAVLAARAATRGDRGADDFVFERVQRRTFVFFEWN